MNINNDITVVICLYNAENYIVETLNSFENQTFKNFDLLVINDCSSDNSANNVKIFFQTSTFQSTEIIHFEENRGTAYTRNFALRHVKTPLMMFFDADDIAKHDLVEKLYTKINENKNCIAISCYSEYIDINSKKIFGGQFVGSISNELFLQRVKGEKLIFMLPPTLFVRKLAILAGGYRLEGFPSGKPRYQDFSEDLDLWSRMSDFYISGKVMLTLPEVLFYYRKSKSSLSASTESLVAMQNKIRYIKHNIKRRRSGKEDVLFVDYMSSRSLSEKVKNFPKDTSVFYYKRAGFLYLDKQYLSFLYYISLSVILNPNYIVEKFNSNFSKR